MTRFALIALSASFLLVCPGIALSAEGGKQVYEKTCATCHAAGIAGAPKLGDAEAWQPRIEKGMDTLVDHAVNGYQGKAGMMPAKGGNPSLSDAEIDAAVKYMIEQSR